MEEPYEEGKPGPIPGKLPSAKNYLIPSGKEYVLYDEERANAFLQTYGAYSASVGEGIHSLGVTVSQEKGEVKP